ncbi:hypothetical protein GOP47_0011150 [Adiantum capillus-veneris]|uniref:Uncharacterized protein n=1 Tax=Adiantum capillus-veneris TaxID=13818 RepID=A0A9D4UTC5_ADICA|nr:hypothetical protein GOP47_0011150 [Adiantum capillus-veneris]
MAAASSSSSSCSLRPALGATSPIRQKHFRSLFLCNANPTVQAMALQDETRSQVAADRSRLSTQSVAWLTKVGPENEQTVCPSQAGNFNKDSLRLHSVSLLPLLAIAALPGARTVAELFEPIAELVRSLDLPDWLVHWGHPGNMAVVLFAMGGYGSYLGWQIRLADDLEVKAKAKDLHPKLLGGMFFFFSLGATGGILSLLTSGKPIFESPHAVTGLSGLALLATQTALTGLFESNPSLRSVHAVLGSGIMLLFLLHAAFGLQLGLSY